MIAGCVLESSIIAGFLKANFTILWGFFTLYMIGSKIDELVST